MVVPARDRPGDRLPVGLGPGRRHERSPISTGRSTPTARWSSTWPCAARCSCSRATIAAAAPRPEPASASPTPSARRLIRDVEKAGLHRDGERWLAEAGAQVLAALADGREATSSGAARRDPAARGLDRLRRGQVVGRPGADRPAGADHAVGGGAHRAGVQRRRLDDVATALDLDGRPGWGRSSTPPSGGRGRRRPGRALAARLRAGHGGRPQVVAGLDARRRCAGRSPTSTRSRSTSTGGPATCSPDDLEPTEPVEPWAALLPPLDPTTMGWFERDWYLGPHKAQLFDTQRQRRADRLVGRPDRRRLAPGRRPARSCSSCSRTSAPRAAAPSRPRRRG